jgi:predicted ATPase
MIVSNLFIRAFKSIYELNFPIDPRISILIGPNGGGKTNILRAIESFNSKMTFDNSLTCQYSEHYHQKKPPEIALEYTNFSKENRSKLTAISEVFKNVNNFYIKRFGPEISDYTVYIDDVEVSNIDIKKLLNCLPKILYFEEIPLIKNRVDYYSLVDGRPGYTTERNLLRIGGLENFEIIFEDSSRGRRAAVETGRIITENIRRVWSQEPSIEIKLNVNGKVLYIDISDSTTVFDTPETRSSGFRWYLSFYINFLAQTYDTRVHEYIFLIDEPGIHLHPAGQKDLLRVLDHLSQKNQIIYTTHSPFLINREFPQRVRLVSKTREGTKVDNEAYRQNWKPLRKSIGLMVGDLFFFSDSSLVFEVPANKSKLFKKMKKRNTQNT